jgi:hypothetical protein
MRSEPPWAALNTLEKCWLLYNQLQEFEVKISVVYSYGSRYNGWPWPGKPYTGPRVGTINLGAMMELDVNEWPKHFIVECQKQAPESHEWVKSQIEVGVASRMQQNNTA